ncbi:MAG: M20/M25/M40 family metallo-hydrolase, partial [Eubacteriales bacterium]|nr:M20/M25/M40 family metallo-hydrolase [Eubacteriales bacterium]
TQEEVGCRGAKTAAYAEEPDVAIALDVTPAADVPEGSKQINARLGAGAAIKIMDRMSISNPEVVDGLFAAAKKGKITVQREVLPYGGTDAGSMQLTRGGVPVCTISIPCRNVHSPVEMIDLTDMEAARRLALEYVK